MIVPGGKEVQNAYRSELAGLYGAVVMVHALCKAYGITQGKVQICCDGLSALNRAISQSGDADPSMQQFDMVAAIRTWKIKSPITWTSKHILGHQDANPWNVLDRYAHYNCEMDTLAKERWERLQREGPALQQKIDGEPWPLYIAGKKVSHNFLAAIYEQASGSKARKYWNDHKQRFGEGSIEDVELLATEDAMKSMSTARQHWLTKHTAGFNAVGKNMLRRKEWTHSKCPRCAHAVEDSEHVLKCKGEGAPPLWDQSIKALEKWMRTISTAPNIIRAICLGLDSWNKEQPMPSTNFSQHLQAAINQQERIGWRNLLEGFPANKWSALQAEYYLRLRSRRSSRRWLAALVKKLAEITWQMWDHRNTVNNEKETATLSIEVNRRIREEYAQGFRSLSNAAQKLAQQSVEMLTLKGLNYRRQWLRSISAHREYQERLRERNEAPEEIRNGKGKVWWIRNGKPSLEEYRAMGF
jgi:hypothetical protein